MRWEGAEKKWARRKTRSHGLKSAYTWNFKQEYACTVVVSGNYNQSIQFCITRTPRKVIVEQCSALWSRNSKQADFSSWQIFTSKNLLLLFKILPPWNKMKLGYKIVTSHCENISALKLYSVYNRTKIIKNTLWFDAFHYVLNVAKNEEDETLGQIFTSCRKNSYKTSKHCNKTMWESLGACDSQWLWLQALTVCKAGLKISKHLPAKTLPIFPWTEPEVTSVLKGIPGWDKD